MGLLSVKRGMSAKISAACCAVAAWNAANEVKPSSAISRKAGTAPSGPGHAAQELNRGQPKRLPAGHHERNMRAHVIFMVEALGALHRI